MTAHCYVRVNTERYRQHAGGYSVLTSDARARSTRPVRFDQPVPAFTDG